jgi:hypothetical protein
VLLGTLVFGSTAGATLQSSCSTRRQGIAPARLPAAGSLDTLHAATRFTSVGYGAQSVTIDHGPTFRRRHRDEHRRGHDHHR